MKTQVTSPKLEHMWHFIKYLKNQIIKIGNMWTFQTMKSVYASAALSVPSVSGIITDSENFF